MWKRAVPLKMMYKYKVAVFSGILAAFTFLLVYVTGPQDTTGPKVRVLYLSFSDHAAVKRILSGSTIILDDSIQELNVSPEGVLVVNREDLDLKSEFQNFYQNNIVLECISSFPVTWRYSGFGDPFVTEKNIRIHGDFNDSSTFSYISLLNLMPITEKSTGLYECFGTDNNTEIISAGVHLFVPGNITFLIDYDTAVEAPGEDNIYVPCPVTNASANISLYFKNELVSSMESLYAFDPKIGFYLKPRFVEEQSDPWGAYYCQNEETKEKSGVISVQPAKSLVVNVIPKSSTIFLSKPSRGNKNSEEKFKFVCQAKEEIALKFLKIVANPMIQYEFNASLEFPFSAFTEVATKNFRNSSRIYCRTVRNNEDLHSWKILFSALSMKKELMDFSYDSTLEEFACCSSSKKKAKVTILNCTSVSECRIKGHCLLPGRKCNADKITQLPERAGCVRFKLLQSNEKDANGNSGNGGGISANTESVKNDSIALDIGILQCSINGKSLEKAYFATRYSTDNGSQLTVFEELWTPNAPGLLSNAVVDSSSTGNSTQLQIMDLREKENSFGKGRRFVCRGTKFFLAVGFVWQIIYENKDVKFITGRDTIKDAWIFSHLVVKSQLSSPKKSASRIKKVYCIAPLWNSDARWVHVSKEVDSSS